MTDTEPAARVTVTHVEAALRGWLAHFEYDLHKATECGEETGEDTYPQEAADLFAGLVAAAGDEPAPDRTPLRDRVAQAIRDSNGTPEALDWWRTHPQLIPAHVYADAVLDVLPAPALADLAAVVAARADGIMPGPRRDAAGEAP